MWIYLFRRILQVMPTLFGIALLVFVLFNLVGGDPAYQMVGRHASAAQLAEIRHEYGLDLPLYRQFLQFIGQILTFDFGRSYATKQSIRQMISSGIGPSLSLAIPAFFLTTFLAVSVGLGVAYFRNRWVDRWVVFFCVIGMSMPLLAYILIGQYYFAFHLGWFPISGYEADWGQRMQYLGLPIFIWVVVSLGYDVRFFRAVALEEVNQDYVKTARAKGLPERWILFKHVFKNCLVPIITNVVLEIPLLVLGSFLLESFFSIPGLGSITIDALHNSDFPVIKAMTVLQAMLFILGNLATDALYSIVDPRVGLK